MSGLSIDISGVQTALPRVAATLGGRIAQRTSTPLHRATELSAPRGNKAIESLITFLSQNLNENSISDFRNHTGVSNPIQFYEDFWDSTKEERAKFFEKLINDNSGTMAFLQQNKIFIEEELLKSFLPVNTKARQEEEKLKPGTTAFTNGVAFAKYIAIALGMRNDTAMLANLFSALVTAIHDHPNTNQDEANERIWGERLCTFLLEAGAVKIAQKINSFDKTPNEWKKGLAKSKSLAEPMGYENFVQQAQAVLPPELWDSITIVPDAHRGSGTYLDTYAVKIKPEYLAKHPEIYKGNESEDFVLQLVKPGSGERSQKSLRLLINAMETLMKAKADARESLAGIVDLFKETERLMQDETDLSKVADKAKMAEKLYQGLKIELPTMDVEFHTPGVFDHSKDYRICREVRGEHFNTIFHNDPSKVPLKKDLALAILSIEIYMMLTGKPFDHDRHGDNQGIEILDHPTNPNKKLVRIGNFDEHGIILQAPTTIQKKIFANILLDALANSALNGFSLGSSLKHTFGRAQRAAQTDASTATDMNYVNHMINAINSQGDYRSVLTKRNLLKALKLVINTGDIDPEISKIFTERLKNIKLQFIPGSKKFASHRLASELARRVEFYPPASAKQVRFTGPLKKIIGIIALGLAPLILSLTPTKTAKLVFPADYKGRF